MSPRIRTLQAQLPVATSLLVTDPLNIRYLCGFTGSFGYLFIGPEESHLLTDSRYSIQSREETKDINIVIGRSVTDFIRDASTTADILFESHHVTIDFHQQLTQIERLNFLPAKSIVEKLRVVKDQQELATMQQAGDISVAALRLLIEQPLIGKTEKHIATMLERFMIDLGAQQAAFDSIVASGLHSAIPHHQPTDRILQVGDLLKIDFGAQVDGYKSDCTRTFVAGTPTQFQCDLHTAVLHAQTVGRQELRNEVQASQIDAVVRTHLADHAYSATFQHGLGHGVGLAIHEDPFLSAKNDTRLTSGTVVTIEPGMYVESRGGVRIEDTVVITDDGYRNLTDFPYDLISL